MLKLHHEAEDSPDRYQVYSGSVRVGTIYRTHSTPGGNEWFWGLNGVENGPGPFNGFVAIGRERSKDLGANFKTT